MLQSKSWKPIHLQVREGKSAPAGPGTRRHLSRPPRPLKTRENTMANYNNPCSAKAGFLSQFLPESSPVKRQIQMFLARRGVNRSTCKDEGLKGLSLGGA